MLITEYFYNFTFLHHSCRYPTHNSNSVSQISPQYIPQLHRPSTMAGNNDNKIKSIALVGVSSHNTDESTTFAILHILSHQITNPRHSSNKNNPTGKRQHRHRNPPRPPSQQQLLPHNHPHPRRINRLLLKPIKNTNPSPKRLLHRPLLPEQRFPRNRCCCFRSQFYGYGRAREDDRGCG